MLWLLKISAKIVLARMPVKYAFWQRLGLFRHGKMDRGVYAAAIFDQHHRRAQKSGLPPAFVGLELGPGDSVASALFARCRGAQSTYLVDVGSFATQDMSVYRGLANSYRAQDTDVLGDIDFSGFEQFLRFCRSTYLVDGLRSLRSLPDASIDFIWSQAVLEHVPRDEFLATMQELYRVLKPGGVASHRVDLKDHLAAGLNNLRFSRQRWESQLFRSSGFYTNRIRYSEMLELFRAGGFEVQVEKVDRWAALPTPRASLDGEFKSIPDEELLVSGFDVVLRKPASGIGT